MMLLLALSAGFCPVFAALAVEAQGNQQQQEQRIEAIFIGYITKELNLTPAEAEKFWPLFNAYRADLKALRANFKSTNGTELTAEQRLDVEQKKLDLKKKYKPEFETVLGHEKLNQLYNLEAKFQEKLKELREQRQQQRNNGGGRAFDRH